MIENYTERFSKLPIQHLLGHVSLIPEEESNQHWQARRLAHETQCTNQKQAFPPKPNPDSFAGNLSWDSKGDWRQGRRASHSSNQDIFHYSSLLSPKPGALKFSCLWIHLTDLTEQKYPHISQPCYISGCAGTFPHISQVLDLFSKYAQNTSGWGWQDHWCPCFCSQGCGKDVSARQTSRGNHHVCPLQCPLSVGEILCYPVTLLFMLI